LLSRFHEVNVAVAKSLFSPHLTQQVWKHE
jgi:hypothetical protein